MNALSIKTKKLRQRSHCSQNLTQQQMRVNLTQMCCARNKRQIICLLKTHVLNLKKQQRSFEMKQRRYQSYFKNDMIAKIEHKNTDFFVPKMEVSQFHRNIDKTISQLELKKHTEASAQPTLQIQAQMATIPQALKLNQLDDKRIQKSSELTVKKRSMTLPCRTREINNKSPNIQRFDSPVFARGQSSKKSNSLNFNSYNRRRVATQPALGNSLPSDWQSQLLQNMNILQGTSFTKKRNVRIDRQKLSNYLKKLFVNQVITEYYKCQNSESFDFMTSMISDLLTLSDREIKIITFFTFDCNQDGFICQNDVFNLLQHLPYNSKILDDINTMVSFLKHNKLNSQHTNFTRYILKARQKTALNALANQSAPSKPHLSKKNKVMDGLFTVSKSSQDSARDRKQAKATFKKYKINFQVFSLIFSEKIPVLISQIVKPLTGKIQVCSTSQKPPAESDSVNLQEFSETRSKEWMFRVNNSKQIAINAYCQNQKLNMKIT